MPHISVSYPTPRFPDTVKNAEIVAAVGAEPVKIQPMYKSNGLRGIDVFTMVKFAYSTKAEGTKLKKLLVPFGEVRDLA